MDKHDNGATVDKHDNGATVDKHDNGATVRSSTLWINMITVPL